MTTLFVFVVTILKNQIPEYERAVVFGSTLDMAFVRGPGLIFVLPFLEKVNTIIATTITNTATIIINITRPKPLYGRQGLAG